MIQGSTIDAHFNLSQANRRFYARTATPSHRSSGIQAFPPGAHIGAAMSATRCCKSLGTFPTQKRVDAHNAKLEEISVAITKAAKNRLDFPQDEIGPACPWHRGILIRLLIENFWRNKHIKDGTSWLLATCRRLDLGKPAAMGYYRGTCSPTNAVRGQRISAQA